MWFDRHYNSCYYIDVNTHIRYDYSGDIIIQWWRVIVIRVCTEDRSTTIGSTFSYNYCVFRADFQQFGNFSPNSDYSYQLWETKSGKFICVVNVMGDAFHHVQNTNIRYDYSGDIIIQWWFIVIRVCRPAEDRSTVLAKTLGN